MQCSGCSPLGEISLWNGTIGLLEINSNEIWIIDLCNLACYLFEIWITIPWMDGWNHNTTIFLKKMHWKNAYKIHVYAILFGQHFEVSSKCTFSNESVCSWMKMSEFYSYPKCNVGLANFWWGLRETLVAPFTNIVYNFNPSMDKQLHPL